MKIIKNMKVGDIYLNPLMQDLWILRKEYIEDLESDNEKWVLALINDDYTEDFEVVVDFIKLGNIYDLLVENQQLKEEINKISKKEIKVRDMLYSIENGTLTRERLMQIEEVLFELEGNNE